MFGAKGFPGVPATGGIERVVEQLTAALGRRGVRCLVYERASRAGWRRVGRTLVRQLPFLDRRNLAFWTHGGLALLDYLRYRDPADVVHVHGVYSAFLCVPLSLLGHRVVFHHHGTERGRTKWGRLMTFWFQLSIPLTVWCSDVIVTPSHGTRRRLAASFPRAADRIACVPNTVPDATAFESRNGRSRGARVTPDRFFLYVGRLVPNKRLELAIRALEWCPGFDLVLAGEASHTEDYVAELLEEIGRRRLGARVQFIGQLAWPELRVLYASCRAVVLPSNAEECSMTLLEALSLGACIVCTDLPENRALLDDAALFAPGDPDGLGAALRATTADAVAAMYRARARVRRTQLEGWEEIGDRFLALYWPDQKGVANVAHRVRWPGGMETPRDPRDGDACV